jgi:hypothetical protein
MEKKIVNVATEKQEASGGIIDDVMNIFSFGLGGGSKDEGYVSTVTYDDGTIETGFGSSKDESIRNATNN